MMLENDYLNTNDIIGASKYQIADGSYVKSTVIILREIKIGNSISRDVRASVSESSEAPLLLGQSAIQKLGKYSIVGNDLIIESSSPKKKYTQETIEKYVAEIEKCFQPTGSLSTGLMYGQELYDAGVLPFEEYPNYAELLARVNDDYSQAHAIFSSIENRWNVKYENDENMLYSFYIRFADICSELDKNPLMYYEKAKRYALDLTREAIAIQGIVNYYYDIDDSYHGDIVVLGKIAEVKRERGIKVGDCWDKNLNDESIGLLLSLFGEVTPIRDEKVQFMSAAAKWGWIPAIWFCQKENISYQTKPYNWPKDY